MHISAHIYAECIQFIDKHTYGIYNIYISWSVCSFCCMEWIFCYWYALMNLPCMNRASSCVVSPDCRGANIVYRPSKCIGRMQYMCTPNVCKSTIRDDAWLFIYTAYIDVRKPAILFVSKMNTIYSVCCSVTMTFLDIDILEMRTMDVCAVVAAGMGYTTLFVCVRKSLMCHVIRTTV